MSLRAIRTIANLTGLDPRAKLTLFQIADAHMDSLGTATTNVHGLARLTGLTPSEISQATIRLRDQGIIRFTNPGFQIASLMAPADGELVPKDYWPATDAISALSEAYPQHDFEMKEAVHDFITFTRQRQIKLAPDRIDGAFVRNISHLLSLRQPGPTTFQTSADRKREKSVGAFLSARD